MISLKVIDTYLSTRLKEIDNSFKEHEDAYNIDNIGSSKLDRAYHILINEVRCSAPSSQVTTDVVSVEMYLFFKGFRDAKNSLISAYDVANALRMNAMKPEFSMTGELIKNVICTNLKAEQVQTNDNVRIKCSFDVTVNFSTED